MLWYLVIFLGTIFEGELVLVLAGFAVYRQQLDLPGVVIAAALGAFAGDLLFFELGRVRGQALFQRYRWLGRRADTLAKMLARFPLVAIFLLRFQIGMRMIGNFSMGCSGLLHARYLPLNLIACVLWSGLLSWLCLIFARIMVPLWSSLLGG